MYFSTDRRATGGGGKQLLLHLVGEVWIFQNDFSVPTAMKKSSVLPVVLKLGRVDSPSVPYWWTPVMSALGLCCNTKKKWVEFSSPLSVCPKVWCAAD